MDCGLKQAAQSATSAFLFALSVTLWAAPDIRAAHSFVTPFVAGGGHTTKKALTHNSTSNSFGQKGRGAGNVALPATARFREVEGRGLMVRVWVNNSGPYNFAIDTGAGATIISRRVAAEARIALSGARSVTLSGLSGVQGAQGREAAPGSLAVGTPENLLPGKGLVIVTDALPSDLDGVLDPAETYWPLGFTINLPGETISAFDPRSAPLRGLAAPPGGAIVQWLFDGSSRRPFVMLDAGRRALLDTGSGFGLAVNESAARSFGIVSTRGRERAGVRDLGRGNISARRVEPITIQIGSLVLRRVPTDLLSGAASGAPVLLGRDALRPFEISFDPVNRLIRLLPADGSTRR
ncbi:MAG TPA: aspartyl protease family protein [Pyrinomonadaceae bacterium]|nr:aspartyl protease family protein [Pyrinomonadaceae bacterium]